ncbi:MAG: 2-C-methyl-D-erythritol 4-phosphate cytidylyltransferase [Halanaerobiaceae bacterium]
MQYGVVVPAAGSGKRMKTKLNKQFIELEGLPIIVHTLYKFVDNPHFSDIVLVVKEDEVDYCQEEILDRFAFDSVNLVIGGNTRRESVFRGLKHLAPTNEYVIIHDGARPLLPEKILLEEVLPALDEFAAVTTGVKVKDTIKRRNKEGFVAETLPRNQLVAIQTPQAFAYDLIMRAHREVPEDLEISDDASLVEELGHPVKVIEGTYENIKITTPTDLDYAHLILQKRG